MTVLVKKSVCTDCVWIGSCQKFKKINEIRDSRERNTKENTNRRDIFDVIITVCSTKNYDRSYKGQIEDGKKLYFCTDCGSMHRENSRIGKKHKKDLN